MEKKVCGFVGCLCALYGACCWPVRWRVHLRPAKNRRKWRPNAALAPTARAGGAPAFASMDSVNARLQSRSVLPVVLGLRPIVSAPTSQPTLRTVGLVATPVKEGIAVRVVVARKMLRVVVARAVWWVRCVAMGNAWIAKPASNIVVPVVSRAKPAMNVAMVRVST